MTIDLEKLNEKIIDQVGKRYTAVNALKHLDRSRKRIESAMKNKYGYLTE